MSKYYKLTAEAKSQYEQVLQTYNWSKESVWVSITNLQLKKRVSMSKYYKLTAEEKSQYEY